MYNKSKCPSCGNTNKGDFVYKCRLCHEVYCEECAGDGAVDTTCPSCGDTFGDKIFEIK